MKVVKRDGQIVDFDRSKIVIAIKKANVAVPEEQRVSAEQIEEIVSYIEGRNRNRWLVEDIQDTVEQKLM